MLAFISYPPIPIVEVGPLRLSLHGLFAALGFLAGAWLASKEVKRRGLDVVKYQSILTWGLIGSLLGARLFTLPAQFGQSGFGLGQAFGLAGNFSIMGGFLGGILAGWWQAHRLGIRFMPYLDATSSGAALGTIVGRIGDLAIVEHLGRETTFFLGYAVKIGYDLAPQHDLLECPPGSVAICGVYHHAALYDLVGAAVLLGVLVLVRDRRAWRTGQFFSVWVVWYGLQRFAIDFVRFGQGDATIGPLTWNQVSGLGAGLLGAAMLVYYGLGPRPSEPGDERPATSAESTT